MMVYAICETRVTQLGSFVGAEHLPEITASGELICARTSRCAPGSSTSKAFERGPFRAASSTRANRE